MPKRFLRFVVSLYFEYGIPKFVKVKAHRRIRRGKLEKVRSHVRRVRGR